MTEQDAKAEIARLAARVEQLTVECRRLEEAKVYAECVLHDLRRRRENEPTQ